MLEIRNNTLEKVWIYWGAILRNSFKKGKCNKEACGFFLPVAVREESWGNVALGTKKWTEHKNIEDHKGLWSIQLLSAKLYFGKQLIIQHNRYF